VQATLGWRAEVVQHDWRRGVWQEASGELTDKPRGFVVLPRRWVVERTFAWLGKYRRLSKEYEALPATSEALIYAAMSGLMLQRLAKRHPQ
jgi:transposase